MKWTRLLLAVVLMFGLLSGCGSSTTAQTTDDEAGNGVLLATTYPMFNLLEQITNGPAGYLEGVTIELMVTEQVSCLHDYTITTEQMKKIERADLIVMNGAGLENFMSDALRGVPAEDLVDSSEGIALIGDDPHIWLDPERYAQQADHVAEALAARYPDSAEVLRANAREYKDSLLSSLEEWRQRLKDLPCREIITFHDGFTYFAEAYDLTILAAIEEEEGAEASASELKEICQLVEDHNLHAVFAETNGSTNAVNIVSRETGAGVYKLDMLMSGDLAQSRDGFLVGTMNNLLTIEDALKEDAEE